MAIRLTQRETITRDLSQSQQEKFGAVMSNNIETIEFYRVVVRRGAVIKPAGVVRKPFVWEIRHRETAQLFGSSAQPCVRPHPDARAGCDRMGVVVW
jgi:hypothetical protein